MLQLNEKMRHRGWIRQRTGDYVKVEGATCLSDYGVVHWVNTLKKSELVDPT